MQKKNVVVIGGGTGTYAALSGLKAYADSVALTAVVAMSDSGGSTGRLRDEFGMLPVGDVRMALLALADEERIDHATLRALFTHRFDRGEGLRGHNLGNLVLAGLSEALGSELRAIDAVAKLLGVTGTVLPVTTESISLGARYDDGVEIVGESSIDEPTPDREAHTIEHLWVSPPAIADARACEAIMAADYIVLGPGDLYTSLLAAMVVGDIADCVRRSPAKFIYISNLMSKRGHTVGYDSAKYVAEIYKYVGRVPDCVFINTATFPASALARYASQNEYPVVDTGAGFDHAAVIRTDIVGTEEIQTAKGDRIKRSLVRHDAHKLAAVLMDYFAKCTTE